MSKQHPYMQLDYSIALLNDKQRKTEILTTGSQIFGNETLHYEDGTFLRCKMTFPVALMILSNLDERYFIQEHVREYNVSNRYYRFVNNRLVRCDVTGKIVSETCKIEIDLTAKDFSIIDMTMGIEGGQCNG